MALTNNERYRNILGTISFAKLGILAFAAVMNVYELFKDDDVLNHTQLNNYIVYIILILLCVIIIFWSFSYIYTFKFRNVVVGQVIEDCAFIFILGTLIILTDNYKSQYKYLFLFSIISSTISSGKKHGITIASVASLFILLVDLFFGANLKVNIYFENDLMLALGFITVAWILGEYKRFESNQIEMLELELKEQLKQHDYIEDMLLKNEDCYNLLIKQSNNAIMIHCIDKILYLNENALKLVGMNLFDETSENSAEGLEYAEDKIKLKEIYIDIINNQKSNVSFEQKIINKNGTCINIYNTSTYCVYGKSPAILTIMRDVTSEKQVRKLEEDVKENIKLLNKSKEQTKFITEFFSNISHELKTPLNVIFSSLQLLNTYNEAEFIKNRNRYFDIMKQNCYRLIRLINNLLDVTKHDAGFIIPNLHNGDIVCMVEDITMSIISYAESKGINIIFDTDIEEKIIAFDADKMERIILNLLSNALKFTTRGGKIYVLITDKEDSVEISVKDTGIGIPDEQKELIFERFMQVDKKLNRNNEGTGIGLSIVKSFVEMHNGEIKLESKLGLGSEFTIILPSKQLEKDNDSAEIKGDITERVNLELSDIYSNDSQNN